jgi:hypothetical protein
MSATKNVAQVFRPEVFVCRCLILIADDAPAIHNSSLVFDQPNDCNEKPDQVDHAPDKHRSAKQLSERRKSRCVWRSYQGSADFGRHLYSPDPIEQSDGDYQRHEKAEDQNQRPHRPDILKLILPNGKVEGVGQESTTRNEGLESVAVQITGSSEK